jgi:anthranilate synthase component 1
MGPIEPSYAAFVELAKHGNLVPVSRELPADSLTPRSAFARVGDGLGSYVWERGGTAEDARYSWVGFDPELCVRGLADRYEEQHADGMRVRMVSDPQAALRETLAEYRPPDLPWLDAPWLGAVGYIRPSLPPMAAAANGGAGEALFAFSIGGTQLLFDRVKGTLRVIVPARIDPHEDLRDTYSAALTRLERAQQHLSRSGNFDRSSGSSRLGELEAMHEAAFSTGARAAEQPTPAPRSAEEAVAIGRSLRVPSAGVDMFDVYWALCDTQAAAYTGFLRFAQQCVIGLSHEASGRRLADARSNDRDASGAVAVVHDALERRVVGDQRTPRTAAAGSTMIPSAAHGGALGWIGFDRSAQWLLAMASIVERAGELTLQASMHADPSDHPAALGQLELLTHAIAQARRAQK